MEKRPGSTGWYTSEISAQATTDLRHFFFKTTNE
jgi:hypothetical protein